ncbi:dihydroorotase [Candidatus Woesearchaeota archaeon]|nr:dihydroorotase [Candidatus Woesearchaeota archaeon]
MLLIKNCKVLVNGEFLERSILVGGNGKITKIGVASELKSAADEVIDATGKHALPGAIDVHVHCREPGMTQKEDFLTASKAAVAGGVTTIFDMPNTKPATTTVALLEEKRKLAAAKCIVNYGFHFGATADNLEEIKKVLNIAAVKVYMGSSTGNLLVTDEKALNDIFGSGKRLMAHAENEAMIKANEEKYRGDSDGAKLHLKIRENSAAAKEVERAIAIGRKHGTRLHICHMSTKEETAIVAAAKKDYKLLSCEVAPHHLFLTADSETATKLGNYVKVNPPLRLKEDVAALWKAINEGVVDMIATDHAPHLREEKEQGYWNAPSGVPGLQTMLPLMLDAVNKGRVSLQQLIRLTSENPAAVFGIKGKGKLAVGMDADITLVDMHKEKTIKNDDMLSKCGWTPFDGWKVKGIVAATIVNGNVICSDGEIAEEKIRGKEVMFNGN